MLRLLVSKCVVLLAIIAVLQSTKDKDKLNEIMCQMIAISTAK